MAERDDSVRAVQMTAREAFVLQIGVKMAAAAADFARDFGYKPTSAQRQELTRAIIRAAHAVVAEVMDSPTDASDEQLDAVAQDMAARAVRAVLGPAPAAH